LELNNKAKLNEVTRGPSSDPE